MAQLQSDLADNPLIFSIEQGLVATIFPSGVGGIGPKKPTFTDEPCTLRLFEHRLCIKRRLDSKLIYDLHIKQINLISSPSQQQVDLLSMDLSQPILKLLANNPNSTAALEELVARLQVQRTKYFPNCQHLQVGETSRLQDLLDARLEQRASGNSLFLAIFPLERFEGRLQEIYTNLIRENDKRQSFGGFIRTYYSMCNYYKTKPDPNLLLTAEIHWSTETSRDINLTDIKSGEDLLPILGAIESNGWFERLLVSGVKVTSDLQKAFSRLTARNRTLKSLSLTDCSITKDFYSNLIDGIMANDQSKISAIDFSGTVIDERGSVSLAKAMMTRQQFDGFSSVRLANCNIPKKTTASLLHNLRNSIGVLAELDLSKNFLAFDAVLALCEFLAGPNQLQILKLTSCHIEKLGLVIGALSRGCLRSLQYLSLDGNTFDPDSSEKISSSFDTFFRSCQSLKFCDLSQTSMSSIYLAHLFGCLGVNIELQDLFLKLRSNNFGHEVRNFSHSDSSITILKVSNLFKNTFPDVSVVTGLDVSGNNFGGAEGLYNLFEALSKHGGLTDLVLENIPLLGHINAEAPDLKELLRLPRLKSLSLADNKLSSKLYPLFEFLHNSRVAGLNLNANDLNDADIFELAKRMISNGNRIATLHLAQNKVSIKGWRTLVTSFYRHIRIKNFQIPTKDLAFLYKHYPEMTERLERDLYSILFRNKNNQMNKTNQMTSPGYEGDDLFSDDQPRQQLLHINRSKPKLLGRISKTRSTASMIDSEAMPAPKDDQMVKSPLAQEQRKFSVDQESFVSLGLRPQTIFVDDNANDFRDQLARILVDKKVSVFNQFSHQEDAENEKLAPIDGESNEAPIPRPRSFGRIAPQSPDVPEIVPSSKPFIPMMTNIPPSTLPRGMHLDSMMQNPAGTISKQQKALVADTLSPSTLKKTSKMFGDDWKARKANFIQYRAKNAGIQVNVSGSTFTDWVKDGISLVQFIEGVLKRTDFPRYKKSPNLVAHKVDNLATLMKYLREKHDFEGEVTGEDLLNGDPKKIEILFQDLEFFIFPRPLEEPIVEEEDPDNEKPTSPRSVSSSVPTEKQEIDQKEDRDLEPDS